MELVFFEMPLFTRLLPDYLKDESYRALQKALMDNPELGNVMPGTGGFRKVRWEDSRRGKGKLFRLNWRPGEKTMSKKRKLFDELMEGVDAMQQQRAGKITLRSHQVKDLPTLKVDADLIRDTRDRLHVSRAVFARRLRVSLRTLENWEQGRARPNAQASALILMVRNYPDTLDKLSSLDNYVS